MTRTNDRDFWQMKPLIYRRHPLNRHSGREATAEGVSKHKITSVIIHAKIAIMWFVYVFFIFHIHSTLVKTIDCLTDVYFSRTIQQILACVLFSLDNYQFQQC